MKQRFILPLLLTLASCASRTEEKTIVKACGIMPGIWIAGPRESLAERLVIWDRKAAKDTFLFNCTEYKFEPNGTLSIFTHSSCGTGKTYYFNGRWACDGSLLTLQAQAGRFVGGQQQSFEINRKYLITVLDSNHIQIVARKNGT